MADRGGYIGRNPGDSSVIVAKQTFEPSGAQTDFTFSSGYTPGYIDVYLNGSRLIVASDYTATDGSVVGLTSAAGNGDVLECVAYKAFNLASINNAAGNFTVEGNLTVNGTTTGISSVSYATTSFGLEGSPNIAVGDITATGNVSIGGTLTYEDVTNIDSVGIITARSTIDAQGDVSIADKIIHTGDTNTAIRFPSNDTFTVETSGSERLRVDSSGMVGIGTVNPEDLLHLWSGHSGASSVGAAQLILESSGSTNWVHFKNPSTQNAGLLWSDADATEKAVVMYNHNTDNMEIKGDDDIIFKTDSATRLTIDASGKAGFTGIVTASKFEGPTNVPAGQTGTVTLAASDAGKHVAATGTVTLGTGIFAVGDAVTIWNNSAGSITITLSAVTCYNAADGTTGNRTLGARGLATILCVAANTYVISGSGLT